jgi:uncharacterized protein YndB with AHSA1/START domain
MYELKPNTMKNNIAAEVKTIINAPVSKVWDALTKPEIIKQYFFGTDTITDWRPGSPIKFMGEWEGKKYEDKGTILEMNYQELIIYNYWSSMSGIEDKPENYVIVTYQLSGEDYNVTLTITQENIPDEKMKTHSEENWKKVMNGLKNLLEQKTAFA